MSLYVSISFILGIYSLPWPSLHFFYARKWEKKTRHAPTWYKLPGQMRESVDILDTNSACNFRIFRVGWCCGDGNRTIPESTRIFSKGLSRWWQLKYVWNFHPETWGRWTHFDEHIFQVGLVQPPTRSRFPWCSWGNENGPFGLTFFGSDSYRDGSRMVMHSARFPFFFKVQVEVCCSQDG